MCLLMTGQGEDTTADCIRSVVGYTISMIGFALLTVYMLFAASKHIATEIKNSADIAVYLAVLGIQSVQQEGVTVDTVFGNTIFRNIVLSLLATYGLYIIASLLALEPWHMGELPSDLGTMILIVSHVFLAVSASRPFVHQRT